MYLQELAKEKTINLIEELNFGNFNKSMKHELSLSKNLRDCGVQRFGSCSGKRHVQTVTQGIDRRGHMRIRKENQVLNKKQ